MKIIIFAGGHGTRLWPLSRKNSPKQFEQIFDGKSTLQLAVERIIPIVDISDIFISTNEKYKDLIKSQLSNFSDSNFILEPERRDLAAAVGLSFFKLKAAGVNEPVAILWADHLMDNADEFRKALQTGEDMIKENPNRFIYLGEKPRFANHNLGWITIGGTIEHRGGLQICEFAGWKYRPELAYAKTMLESGKSLWNPGYWITSIDFVIDLYKKLKPEMALRLEEIVDDPAKIDEIYPTLESTSFDDAIIEQTTPEQAVVIKVDLGWSDPGTLYALKEALAESTIHNVTQGKTVDLGSRDCLIINKEDEKLLSTIGLEGFVVVNTKDAILVVHKDKIPKVKELVQKLKEEGLEKYI